MPHPNIILVREFYEAFARGDTAAMLEHCAADLRFVPAGKQSQLAGERRGGRAVLQFMADQQALTDGTWIPRPIDILASDAHAVALVVVEASRHGQTAAFRLVHVWHIEQGRATELHSYVDDQYRYDAFFA